MAKQSPYSPQQKMIAVDTNILARMFLEDAPKESSEAQLLLDTHVDSAGIYISPYVMMEFAWVLASKKYKYSRVEIADIMRTLLDAPGVTIGQRTVIVHALEHYQRRSVSFSDCLILADSQQQGARTLASFDKELCSSHPSCRHPSEIL